MVNIVAAIGGLVGFAMGGPAGAALGAGIGSSGSGSSLDNILKDAGMAFGAGAIPGVAGMATGMAGKAGLAGLMSPQALAASAPGATFGGNLMSAAQPFLGAGAKTAAKTAATGLGSGGTGATGGLGSLTDGLPFDLKDLAIAQLMASGQPKPIPLTEQQKYLMRTGETSDYQGTATPQSRATRPTMMAAQGGYIEGPGTGKSDSIPAMIYQNGGPVQEAALSDGEFVMTADAVKGAGDGSRAKGAAEMYRMMNQYERRA